MNLTNREEDLLKKYVKVVKRMTRNFKRNYSHLDEGAFEGELLERLCILIKNGAANHQYPDEYITACVRNRARTLVKKSYFKDPLRYHYLGLSDNTLDGTNATHEDDNGKEIKRTLNELVQPDTSFENIQKEEISKTVTNVLEKCDKNQKDIAELVLEGHSFSEIARLLGVSHHSEITRSIRRLRVKLNNPFKD
jgi:RNA polymerase sigma factor (sigma-70 family)